MYIYIENKISDIIYIKYDKDNLKYIYSCNYCGQKWTNIININLNLFKYILYYNKKMDEDDIIDPPQDLPEDEPQVDIDSSDEEEIY